MIKFESQKWNNEISCFHFCQIFGEKIWQKLKSTNWLKAPKYSELIICFSNQIFLRQGCCESWNYRNQSHILPRKLHPGFHTSQNRREVWNSAIKDWIFKYWDHIIQDWRKIICWLNNWIFVFDPNIGWITGYLELNICKNGQNVSHSIVQYFIPGYLCLTHQIWLNERIFCIEYLVDINLLKFLIFLFTNFFSHECNDAVHNFAKQQKYAVSNK